MNRRLFGAFGVLAVVALPVGGCKSDPLSNVDGTPAALYTDFSFLEVNVGAELPVTATVLDARSTPLEVTVTFRTCNATVTVGPDTSYHPLPPTTSRTLVHGVTYGTSCVIAEYAGLSDTVQVATFPASIALFGPDTLGSGATALYTYEFRSATGAPVAGVPAPTFASADTTRVKIVPAAPLGTFTALAPGAVTVRVTGVGSPAAGVTSAKSVTVVAGSFVGGVSPPSGDPTDTIKLTNAVGGPGFDADTRVFINNVRTFTFGVTADSVKAIVPGVGVAGSVVLAMQNMGPGQLAQNGAFTSTTALFADHYDAVNDDPATAPALTLNGDYYIVMHGTCTDGVVTDPGDDCDDFFAVTNPGGVEDTMSVNAAWFDGADVDILWCKNATCSGPGNVITGGGATSANPENSTVRIPAGATWYLWLNYFAPGGTSTLVRVRLTNKN